MPEGGTFEFDQGVNNNYKHFSLFIYRLSACPYMSLMSNLIFAVRKTSGVALFVVPVH